MTAQVVDAKEDQPRLEVLISGATGSFGRAFTTHLLTHNLARRIVVFSRDEYKQHQMRDELGDDSRLRFFLGDVRDGPRVRRAMRNVELVVHAAALKQVPALEYNPDEAIKTNILGAENLIEAALHWGTPKVLAISTDKACNPVNLYGATKLCAEKLFIAANAYTGRYSAPTFSAVRYGNVSGSRGSVIPLFRSIAARNNSLPITDSRMSRFWITLDEAVHFVWDMAQQMEGGEVFIPKLPSYRVLDLAGAISPGAKWHHIGIRQGEKVHETLIGADEAPMTYDRGDYYVLSADGAGRRVPSGFSYTSDRNTRWLDVAELQQRLEAV